MFETQFDTYPKEPGCYLMRDKAGKVFYVGKAINLRNRIRSYFSGQDTRKFVFFLERILHKIDIIVVSSDREAILLEKTLIEKYKPKYNILLKDGKNFISLRLSKPNLKVLTIGVSFLISNTLALNSFILSAILITLLINV